MFHCDVSLIEAGCDVKTLRLADIGPGERAIVADISGRPQIAARLMEMGFVPGALIEVVRRAPFGGPVQYRVRGVSVSMRPVDASCILVDPVSEDDLALQGIGMELAVR